MDKLTHPCGGGKLHLLVNCLFYGGRQQFSNSDNDSSYFFWGEDHTSLRFPEHPAGATGINLWLYL